MKNVIIYTADNCSYCHDAKDFFDANNISYIEHNISKDIEARKDMMKKKIMSVPLIVIDGQDIIGFDVDEVRDLLYI